MFEKLAYAAPQMGATDANPLISFLPFVLLMLIFYFLLIRPQQKRQKEHRDMVAKIAVGDEIVTGGGVLGTVTETGESFVHVEIADGVQIKIQRHTIGAVMPKGTMKNA